MFTGHLVLHCMSLRTWPSIQEGIVCDFGSGMKSKGDAVKLPNWISTVDAATGIITGGGDMLQTHKFNRLFTRHGNISVQLAALEGLGRMAKKLRRATIRGDAV